MTHAGGCRWLELHRSGARITLQVADPSAIRPQARIVQPDATSGRGLALITMMTDGWHTADHDGGKRVWATLTPHP